MAPSTLRSASVFCGSGRSRVVSAIASYSPYIRLEAASNASTSDSREQDTDLKDRLAQS
jgi:hypothetical protein